MTKKTFYVTTPIYYPTAKPHLGSAYTTIAADILSRWNKLLEKETFFLTGTDEHGKKLEQAAEKAGKKPKTFIDSIIPEFKSAWKKLNIKYDRFIRTTDADHEQVVQTVLSEVHKKGYIYEGYYEGLYCTGCEAYYTEKDLENGCCPIHHNPIEKLKEESYFFKLSKYKKKLLDFYKKNPYFISPPHRKQEIINRINEGLQDLSISRTSFSWGIPLPFDKKHVCFVWFDALLNYVTGIGYLEDTRQFKKFWPADVHLVGKDILWFHAVIWPAILMSAGIELPKKVFAHGWLTIKGNKIGKSAGNAVDLDVLSEKVGVDSIRYSLFRETPFGQDGEFEESVFIDRHNNELANKLGNLVSRVSTLAELYGLQKTKTLDNKKLIKSVTKYLESLEFDKALNDIFGFIDNLNELIQNKKPWETKDKKVLYILADGIKTSTILLSPFMPETCEKISKIFKFDIDLKNLKNPLTISKIKKASILFNKIEHPKEIEQKKIEQKPNKPAQIEGIMTLGQIKYEDFAKLDLRVGTIKKADDIEGADKLYKLEVDLGTETRTILAGIKQYYDKKSLIGKQIICIVNLEPRKMKGLESQGMLLAAGSKEENVCVLISPEKNVKSGLKIS